MRCTIKLSVDVRFSFCLANSDRVMFQVMFSERCNVIYVVDQWFGTCGARTTSGTSWLSMWYASSSRALWAVSDRLIKMVESTTATVANFQVSLQYWITL